MPRIGIVVFALLASAGCKDKGTGTGTSGGSGSAATPAPAKVPGHCKDWGKCYDHDGRGPMTACEASAGTFAPGPCPTDGRVGRCVYKDAGGGGTRYYYPDWEGGTPAQDCERNGPGWTYQAGGG